MIEKTTKDLLVRLAHMCGPVSYTHLTLPTIGG